VNCLSVCLITNRASSILPSFRPCTTTEVRRIIMSSPVKSCSLDAAPTFLVREFVDVLLPYLTAMVNASLTQGRLPVSQRHAIATPLLKKTGVDSADMSNFRPVSNLSFMSKVVERAVVSQLTEYLSANDLLPCLQSAYRKSHSTETAMLRVWSDVLMAADVQEVTLLAMLDLSAAFDCVDYTIYCNGCRLEQVSQTLSSNGSPPSCLNARNRSPTMANCPQSNLCCSAFFHKEASLVHCCTCSTLLNCSPS